MTILAKGQLLRAKAPHPNAGMEAVVIAEHEAGSDFQSVYWLEEVRPQASAFDPIAIAHVDTWFDLVDDEEKRRLHPGGIAVPSFFVYDEQIL